MDIDRTDLTYSVVTPPANGTVTYNAQTKKFSYAPNLNYNGNDSFTYKVNDGQAESSVGTVNVTVNAVNDTPVLSAANYTMTDSATLSGTFNASDVDGDNLTAVIITQPINGSISVTPGTRNFVYIGAKHYVGTDRFSAVVNDGKTNSLTVNFNITITQAINEDDLTPNLVANCANDPTHNTCIFWKNPVAQNKAAIAGGISSNTSLAALQINAVNITPDSYDNSGFLKNSSIDVYMDSVSNTAARVTTDQANFKFAYANDAFHRVSQVITFYWIDIQIKYMMERVGTFFAKDKNIKVFAFDPNVNNNAYWNSTNKEIRLGKNLTQGDIGLGAEITHHEMGHANVFFASNGAINNYAGGTDKYCVDATEGNICCVDSRGCSFAVNEGLADYHANILFDSDVAVGQAMANNINGLPSCGIFRRSDMQGNLTAGSAFSACGAFNTDLTKYNGEVHVMGTVYAAIWFELRKLAKAVNAAEVRELDRLFNEHLKVLTGADNFATVYNKLRAIDSALFGNKFGARLQAEFQKRQIIQ